MEERMKGMPLGENSPKSHRLKTLPEYYKFVSIRVKNFEIRKNDRDYRIGDTLVLCEWSEDTGYTRNETSRKVKYILENAPQFGLQEGYCILGW